MSLPTRKGRRVTQCRKLRADRTGDVVHDGTGQPPGPMLGDRLGGGLLQRIVGEQPVRRVGELGRRPSAQQHSLDQNRRVIAELPSYRSDIGDPRRIRQPVAVDIAQRLRSRLAAQIGDRIEAEIYDGLTPVTMTL